MDEGLETDITMIDDKLQQRMRPLILKAMNEESGYDMAQNHLRYEALRKLTPQKYSELCVRCVLSDIHFDDAVDELILQNHKP